MTIIVADTTCGLPRELLHQRGISFVPQVVIFGNEFYHDDRELDTATFLRNSKHRQLCRRPPRQSHRCITRYLQEARRKGRVW